LFIKEDDIGTSLEEGVSGRETGETTTDNDNASHWGYNWRERWKFEEEEKAVLPAPITFPRIHLHVFFVTRPHGPGTPDLDLDVPGSFIRFRRAALCI
jgi:hypothetical protein